MLDASATGQSCRPSAAECARRSKACFSFVSPLSGLPRRIPIPRSRAGCRRAAKGVMISTDRAHRRVPSHFAAEGTLDE